MPTSSTTSGESLADVAERVNSESGTTGVTATVSGNDLVFHSVDAGSAAQVNVELTDVTYTTSVSGVNGSQISSFAVDAFTDGAAQTLSGNVTQTAGKAELTFTGGLGLVGRTSTFTLTGNTGSATISTTTLQTLSNLATQINNKTAQTGVTATVQGNTLKFNSTGVGSAATVQIQVTSGNFPVSGGSGGIAHGTDATATINGVSRTASANTFHFTDAMGTYTFTTASGFTGALSTVNISSQADPFVLTGGNGQGQATGLDALATVNGAALTGAGNHFSFSDAQGAYEFDAVAGYTGTFSSITVQSEAADFNLAGGDGAGNATGADSVALFNGQTITGTNENQFTVHGAHGTYEVTFADGFAGSFDTVTAKSEAANFNLTGGNGAGNATGADSVAVINGQTLSGNGNHFTLQGEHGSYTIDFADGFSGAFDSVTVRSAASSFELAGGDGAGNATGADSVAVINGQTLTGTNENQFTVQGEHGSYTIDFADGFSGAFAAVTVQSAASAFDLAGGDGAGNASGADSVAIINGQSITGNGNQFSFAGEHGAYELTFAEGFTGEFASFTARSEASAFDLTGGDEAGSATGADSTAIINGETITGHDNRFTIHFDHGTYELEFTEGFSGEFDSVTVRSQAAAFSITGGDESGAAHGSDFHATINGQEFTNTTSHVTLVGEHGTYDIDFAAGFSGAIDPISVTKGGTAEIENDDAEGRAFGHALTAVINGEEKQGEVNTVRHVENGMEVTLEFQAGYVGQFDSIGIYHHSQTRGVTSTQPAPSAVRPPAEAETSATAAPSTGTESVAAALTEIDALSTGNNEPGAATSEAASATADFVDAQSRNEVVQSLANASAVTRVAMQTLANSAQRIQRQLLIDLLG